MAFPLILDLILCFLMYLATGRPTSGSTGFPRMSVLLTLVVEQPARSAINIDLSSTTSTMSPRNLCKTRAWGWGANGEGEGKGAGEEEEEEEAAGAGASNSNESEGEGAGEAPPPAPHTHHLASRT